MTIVLEKPAPPRSGSEDLPPSGGTPARGARALRVLGRLSRLAFTRSVAVVALLVLWELAPRLELADRTFLPPFTEVAAAWWELALDGRLWENTEASLVRSGLGFGLAVLGVITSLEMARRVVAYYEKTPIERFSSGEPFA